MGRFGQSGHCEVLQPRFEHLVAGAGVDERAEHLVELGWRARWGGGDSSGGIGVEVLGAAQVPTQLVEAGGLLSPCPLRDQHRLGSGEQGLVRACSFGPRGLRSRLGASGLELGEGPRVGPALPVADGPPDQVRDLGQLGLELFALGFVGSRRLQLDLELGESGASLGQLGGIVGTGLACLGPRAARVDAGAKGCQGGEREGWSAWRVGAQHSVGSVGAHHAERPGRLGP